MAKAKFQTNEIAVDDILSHRADSLVPPWFQRNTVWDRAQQRRYIQSVFDGAASTPFVVADIEKCRKRNPSANYDVLNSQGWLYIVLDSMQRLEALDSFRNNQYTWSGTVKDRGQEYIYENKFYKDLGPEARHAFDGARVVWQEYTNIPFEDLPDIFERLNDGKPLNAQEKRNATQTYIAQWVRERAGKKACAPYKEAMGPVFSKEQRLRMVDAEYISKFLLFASEMKKVKGTPEKGRVATTPTKLNAYYAKGKECFNLSQGSFSPQSMGKYNDGELDFLDEAVKFHAAAYKAYTPEPNISAFPTATKNISVLLLSIWTQAVIWSKGDDKAKYGLNKENFLRKILSTDIELQEEDITGTGYRELVRVNWQGSVQRCSQLLERLNSSQASAAA
tara:strand:- start:757 stop:1932 length:1176 start_codon:yes stop_codon:yes gene_type:complete